MSKTRPSVNQLPNMNRQNLERKEVRLGTIQIVGILGVTIGSIIAAFCLGFQSGRTLAYERTLTNSLASLPKLPIGDQESGADLGEKIVSEVYAKLNEQNETAPPPGSAAEEESSFPELGTIKESENSKPESEDLGEVELEAPPAKHAEKKPVAEEKVVDEELSLEQEADESEELPKHNAKPEEKTLAAVLNESKARKELEKKEEAKVEVKPTATSKPEPTKVIEKPKVEKTPEPVATKIKEEKPKEEKKTADSLTPKKVSTGWYAQIAAPKAIADANALSSNLRKSGFPAVIETAEVRGEKYYRVIVGPETSKTQADVLLKQLKRESYIVGEPFLRMVK